MAFKIYVVENGFILHIVGPKSGDAKYYVFSTAERMKMLALIDSRMGPEPENEARQCD